MKPTPKERPTQRSVLAMSAARARSFFLKPESYFRIELPPYFGFSGVLRPVAVHLGTKPLNEAGRARQYPDVNYTLYSNKDGQYAWRPFQLIHPVLYVDLVRFVTEPSTWGAIRSRFADFAADPRIRCLSVPAASLTKRSDQGAQILHWWQSIEQASIELALDFGLVFHADVADCYSSIYTHSVAWALHEKNTAKAKKADKTLLGNALDWRLQNMSQGQTNGIPQGSVLLDFVAELVLGYADLELSRALSAAGIREFQVLRYRDDYRVFANSAEAGEVILRALTDVLARLGLKLNASKTTSVQAVVGASIKSDKWAWMRGRQFDRSLQKHLLLIQAHGTEFPNSGSLVRGLDEFYRRVSRRKRVVDSRQLISIAVDIGYNNPRCFPACAAIVSKLLSTLGRTSEKVDTVSRIRRKLDRLPNSGHLEVWLQRITHPFDPAMTYRERLCALVQGTKVDLWNSAWIKDGSLKRLVESTKVVDKRQLKKLRPIVPRLEFTPFDVYER